MAHDSSGTISMVFTDIAGSTHLLHELGEAYAVLIADHHRIITAAAEPHGGALVDSAGDGLFLTFPTARGALLGCIEAQRGLAGNAWPGGVEVAVRMGIHTGEPIRTDARLIGIDVHRASRISAAGHGRQILVSEAARALLGGALPDGVTLVDLGEHRLKDLPAPERLYQVVADGLPSEFPPVRSLDTLPNNLPRQLSSFVGRGDELLDAERRLGETSILTLTGPGGVGKTRLALQVGTHLLDEFPDGVWLVELASVTDGELVPDAIAQTLRLKQAPGQDRLDQLVDALGTSRALVILDNCEHLLEPVVETVDGLMRGCPDIRVLTTSREALGLPGESLMAVPSMSLPTAEAATLEEARACDAVQLFVDRARAVQPSFTLTASNAQAIVQICRRLDGIPLAVELAAARIRMLPVGEIASRLDDRFRLLTGGSRTSLPRHRTLRATMDWSYDLLGPDEQVVLRRLSVFAGSCSLEAAEAVCAGGAVDARDMLDLLGRLVDRSLLVLDMESAEARYWMLETIRDYGQERLAESEEVSEIYGRHLDWFASLVQRARPAFFSGPVQQAWLSRLAADHDNLVAALRWADADPDGADAELALASGLWRYWEIRGHLAEGSAWLDRALARAGGAATTRRAAALTGAGVLAAQRGDLAAAASYHEASLLIQRELGDPRGIATACSNLASVAVERGDFARADALYRESIAQCRAGGDERGAAFSILNLADAAAREGTAEADALYEEALRALRAQDEVWGVAHATGRLARLARTRGNLDAAASRYQEALELNRRLGDTRGEAQTLASLGDVAADGGDAPRAEAYYLASLALRADLGDRSSMAAVLERLAGVSEDRPERAAVLLGAAQALREVIGAPLTPSGMARLDQFLAGLHDAIGRDQVEEAMARGGRLPLAEVVAYASAVEAAG